jgi:N utilization substance protein A
MNAEFFSAIADIEKEKGIPQSYMLEKIEQALLAALKKDSPACQECARVELDPVNKTVHMYLQKTVADPVEDPGTQLSLEEARKLNANAAVGDLVSETVTPRNSAGSRRRRPSRSLYRIREAERGIVYDDSRQRSTRF